MSKARLEKTLPLPPCSLSQITCCGGSQLLYYEVETQVLHGEALSGGTEASCQQPGQGTISKHIRQPQLSLQLTAAPAGIFATSGEIPRQNHSSKPLLNS